MARLDDFYFQIPLKSRVNDKDEDVGPAPRSYKELRDKLFSMFAVPKNSRIEYMDDYGEFQIVEYDESYADALRCSNGQVHYIYRKEEVVRIASSRPKTPPLNQAPQTWRCQCEYSNPENAKICGACKRPPRRK